MFGFKWLKSLTRVFNPGQRPHVTSWGGVQAKDADSAIAQFRTEFPPSGAFPANTFLAGPITENGTPLPQWVLETYYGEQPPPETDTFKRVS